MAFASIILGSILGFFSAVTGAVLFDLAFWQSLLVYSASGVLFAILAITTLVLRSGITMEKQATASA
ncbi:hypothetical protein [Pseudophaeobacter arcticus]|jgi:hypothetical protein|uniref:hypothetical protein n=1 Tax=Pseudophaeobacter arcticus TaxID=385492 RepID=UPI00041C700A|nr:hypothetical protein [Pseudophaeobacter arcticus]